MYQCHIQNILKSYTKYNKLLFPKPCLRFRLVILSKIDLIKFEFIQAVLGINSNRDVFV